MGFRFCGAGGRHTDRRLEADSTLFGTALQGDHHFRCHQTSADQFPIPILEHPREHYRLARGGQHHSEAIRRSVPASERSREVRRSAA